jgi:hypothetical protein
MVTVVGTVSGCASLERFRLEFSIDEHNAESTASRATIEMA